MMTICMRVLLGSQHPGHPDLWQQGHGDMLLSYQLVDGCHAFSSILPSSGMRCCVWICETVLFQSCPGGCSRVFPKPVPSAGQLQRGQAVLAKLFWQESLTTALEACWGVPSPTGCCTCDKTSYQPGGLVTEPSGVRLCSGSSTLHLLQSWSLAEVPGVSWGTRSGGQYLKWGPRAAVPTLGCVGCVSPRASPPPLLACEGPTATTVCAPAGLVPRQRAAQDKTCFPLLFPIFCRLFPSA